VLLTVKNAARLLGVSDKTIYRWVSAARIPHTRVGDQYRFSRAELLAWATSAGRRISPHTMTEPESADAPLPTLAQALAEGGIYYRVGGTTPTEVIREIAKAIRMPAGIDRDYVRDALTARESLASTAAGNGIAIPHIRHPLHELDKPHLALCFLARDVDWKAMDMVPTRIVFVLFSPTTRSHLHLLSRLTFAIRDPEWLSLLKGEALREEILDGLMRAEAKFGG